MMGGTPPNGLINSSTSFEVRMTEQVKQLTPDELRATAGISDADMQEFFKAWASTRIDMLMGRDPNMAASKVIVNLWDKIKPYVQSPEPDQLVIIERIRERVRLFDLSLKDD
jgi:hypothetical protein